MSVRQLTIGEEFLLTWELEAELHWAVLTFYGVCCANGLWTGWVIGNALVGKGWW